MNVSPSPSLYKTDLGPDSTGADSDTLTPKISLLTSGGFIIRETFDDVDDRNSIAKTHWSVSQSCFVAADASPKDMAETSSNSNSLYRHFVRLTHYHIPYDSVLKLSNVKPIAVAPRAGRVGLPESAPAKAVGVDCGARVLRAHSATAPVVVSVHGYNVTQSGFIQRHHKTRSGLAKAGYKGKALSFDWPARRNAA